MITNSKQNRSGGVMSAHTPGPWKVALNGKSENVTRFVWRNDGDDTEANANYHRIARHISNPKDATAIAALPDVLGALASLVERCDGAEGVREDGSNIDTRSAHAALAKAGYPGYETEDNT